MPQARCVCTRARSVACLLIHSLNIYYVPSRGSHVQLRRWYTAQLWWGAAHIDVNVIA